MRHISEVIWVNTIHVARRWSGRSEKSHRCLRAGSPTMTQLGLNGMYPTTAPGSEEAGHGWWMHSPETLRKRRDSKRELKREKLSQAFTAQRKCSTGAISIAEY
jgi:hypothetical protein